MKKTKDKSGLSSSILLIVIATLILLIAIIFFVYVNNKVKNNNSQNAQVSNPVENQTNLANSDSESSSKNEIDNEDEDDDLEENDNINYDDLIKWVGTYNNENVSIKMSLISDNLLRVSFSDSENFSNKSILCSAEDNKLKYDDSFMDSSSKAEITYNDDDTISVKASSDDEEDVLNNVNGDYTKEELEEKGWTGIYKDEETTIAISEVLEDEITIEFSKDNNVYSTYLDEYTEDELLCNKESFGETEHFLIEKTDDGITIEANSTEEDSILNEISGEYPKL